MHDEILVTRSSMPPFDDFVEMIRPLWETHWLTNMGALHRELERKLAEYLDVPYLSLMVNGHIALELTIQSFNFPVGAEVITTPFTFISTTHAIVRNGLKPVFCDVRASDGTMDASKLDALVSEHTAAILPVHVYGNVCDAEAIQDVADRYGLKVIYDAAHAFGVKYRGAGVGRLGDASMFSFHATKAFNTIEGGAVAFSDPKMYDRLYDLKNFGIRGEEHVASVGANAKMNEFCAAMGLCNLRRVDEAAAARARIYDLYMRELSSVRGVRMFVRSSEQSPTYAYFPILIEDDYPLTRDQLFDKMKAAGIRARKYFYPLTSDQACFRNKYRDSDLSVARDLSRRVLTIPFYEELSVEDAHRVVDEIARS